MPEDIHTHPKFAYLKVSGHRDLRSTQIYAKISNNKISEDTDKLEERIKDKFRLVGVEQ